MSRTPQTGENDDRTDVRYRDRIDELVASWDHAVARLDFRYARVAKLTYANSILALLSVAFCFMLLSRTTESATENKETLCSLKRDLDQRVKSGEKFLKENPKGIPGVPVATIRTNLDNQKRTVAALANLRCD